MQRWTSVIGILLLALFVVPLAHKPQQAQVAIVENKAHGFVTNIYGHRLSWKGQLPIKLYLHESVPEAFVPAMRRAIAQWESAVGHRLFDLGSERLAGSKQEKGSKDGKNVIYVFGKGEWTGPVTDQAKTYISWVGDEITDADIVINADLMNFNVDGPLLAQQVDLESVFVHELGHVLGLDHEDGRPSIMATFLRDGESRRQVFKADVAALQGEY